MQESSSTANIVSSVVVSVMMVPERLGGRRRVCYVELCAAASHRWVGILPDVLADLPTAMPRQTDHVDYLR